MLKSNRTLTHFHAGHNDAGYLPESDPETFDTFEDAKRYMFGELLWAADNMASWADEHDCDDVPCPTYGDECPEQLASEVTLAVLTSVAGAVLAHRGFRVLVAGVPVEERYPVGPYMLPRAPLGPFGTGVAPKSRSFFCWNAYWR